MSSDIVSKNLMPFDFSAPNSTGSAPPAKAVPVGTVDCHHHIFDPRFPKPPGKAMRVIATVSDYALLKRKLGIQRSVVVAAASYGLDNSCLLDALDCLGDDARGVAMVDVEVTDREMKALDARRVRGARFYLEKGARVNADSLINFSRRAADIDWHIEIQPSRGEALVAAMDIITKLECRVVIDHLGYTPQPDGARHPAAEVMKRLIDTGRVWIKLSGLYFTSIRGFPDYEDVDELASNLIKQGPDRMLWGTDWPHSGEKVMKPDDSKLLDQTERWTPYAAERYAMLVENPAQLYWGH